MTPPGPTGIENRTLPSTGVGDAALVPQGGTRSARRTRKTRDLRVAKPLTYRDGVGTPGTPAKLQDGASTGNIRLTARTRADQISLIGPYGLFLSVGVQQLGCDFHAFSGHKIVGRHQVRRPVGQAASYSQSPQRGDCGRSSVDDRVSVRYALATSRTPDRLSSLRRQPGNMMTFDGERARTLQLISDSLNRN